MSYRIITPAWETILSCPLKLLLISLADQANDSGICWPCIHTLAKRTGLSDRSIYRHLNKLEQLGHISRDARPGRSNMFNVHPCQSVTPDRAPSPPSDRTPANLSPTPDITMSYPPATGGIHNYYLTNTESINRRGAEFRKIKKILGQT